MNTNEQMNGWQEPVKQMNGSLPVPQGQQSEDVGMGQKKVETTEPQAR